MISAELLITFTLSIHVKFLPNKLFKGVIPPSKECDPPFKMTRQICRITVFGGHCWFECSFFPVMLHINKNYLKLSIHWYNIYMYVPFCKTVDDVTFQFSLRHHFWPRLKKTVEHNPSVVVWQLLLFRLRCIAAHRDHFVRRLSVRPSVRVSVR